MSEIPGTGTGLENLQNTGGEATQAPEARSNETESTPKPVKGANATTGNEGLESIEEETTRKKAEGGGGGGGASSPKPGTEETDTATNDTTRTPSTQKVLEELGEEL